MSSIRGIPKKNIYILACHLPKSFRRAPKPQREHRQHNPGCEHHQLNVNIKPKRKITSTSIIEAKMHKGDSSDMIYTNMLGLIPSIFPSVWISPILCHQNFQLSLTLWTCLVLSLLALLNLFLFLQMISYVNLIIYIILLHLDSYHRGYSLALVTFFVAVVYTPTNLIIWIIFPRMDSYHQC